MSGTLTQVVDMRRPEADGIASYVEIDEAGRHVLELVETGGECDACDEPELVNTAAGVTVREKPVYKLSGASQSGVLCQEHVAQQPYHAGFAANGGEV